MTEQFLSDCPRLLGDLRAAIACGDGAALEQAAHSLKGAVANFAAAAAVEAAARLEQMGRARDLAFAEAGLARLEAELEHLNRALADLPDALAVS